MVIQIRVAVVGVIVGVFFSTVPLSFAHAQQPSDISLLLAQITELTELVVALQERVQALQEQKSISAQQGAAPIEDEIVLTVPVYVYLLNSNYGVVDAWSTPQEIEQLFYGPRGLNERYWSQAHISWELQKVSTYTVENGTDREYVRTVSKGDRKGASKYARNLISDTNLPTQFTVFIAHDFSGINENGFYFPRSGQILVSETNGRDSSGDYITYLIAHELGHALGLVHEGDFVNLMHAGRQENTVARGNRTELLEHQVKAARIQAQTGKPFGGLE